MVVGQRRATVTWTVERAQIATHFAEALVDEGIWDVEQIADYGVPLWAWGIGQTGGVASPVLDVGVGDEGDEGQDEPCAKRA